MGGHTEIHLICMFGLDMLYDSCKVDEGFRHIVSDQPCPEFVLVVYGLDKRGRIGVPPQESRKEIKISLSALIAESSLTLY